MKPAVVPPNSGRPLYVECATWTSEVRIESIWSAIELADAALLAPVFNPWTTRVRAFWASRTACEYAASEVDIHPMASRALSMYWLLRLTSPRSWSARAVPAGLSDGALIGRPEESCDCRLASREAVDCRPASDPYLAEASVTR